MANGRILGPFLTIMSEGPNFPEIQLAISNYYFRVTCLNTETVINESHTAPTSASKFANGRAIPVGRSSP